MKICGNCGKPNEPNSNFCEHCGSALPPDAGNMIADRYEIRGALEIRDFFTRYETIDTQEENRECQILEIRMVRGHIPEAEKMLARENRKAELIKTLEAPDPIPCGFSMGGAITQQILLDYPDLARAAILICSGATMPVGSAIFESIQNDYNGFVDFLCKIAASKKSAPGVVRSFRDDLLKTKAETTLGDFTACNSFDVTTRLSSIAVPVLIVTAEEDKLTPPQHGEALELAIKNSTRTHIHEAGHIVAVEKSEAVNQTILQFLNQTAF